MQCAVAKEKALIEGRGALSYALMLPKSYSCCQELNNYLAVRIFTYRVPGGPVSGIFFPERLVTYR